MPAKVVGFNADDPLASFYRAYAADPLLHLPPGGTSLGPELYAAVDRLLFHLVDRRVAVDELVDMGHDPAFVEAVLQRVRTNQYKRRPPIIAKVSLRTIDREFRYPRDWGV